MKCLTETQMSRYLSGGLSGEENDAIRAHVLSCVKCRSLHEAFTDITDHLRSDNAAYHSESEIHRIMTIINVGKANTVSFRTPRVYRMRTLLAVAAVLLAAIAVGGIWLTKSKNDTDLNAQFQERADGGTDQDAWVSLQIFENRGGTYRRVTQTISSSASLAFRYKDYSKKPYKYLMILAIDEKARVFWYYPPYVNRNANPKSIEIEGKKGRFQLPDEVSHNYDAGMIDVIAIFSRQPLTVHEVERNIARDFTKFRAPGGLERLNIEGTAQDVQKLTVETEP